MNIEIMELDSESLKKYDVKSFLFKMVKICYNLDYVPEYHYDIIDLEKYYLNPEKSNFYIAVDTTKDMLIGTSAIRNYDKDYDIKDRTYSKDTTASFHRVFVHPDYRHHKIGSKLIRYLEDFCYDKHYSEIYLHTSDQSYGALDFWRHNNYEITYNTHNEDGTIHMEKVLV